MKNFFKLYILISFCFFACNLDTTTQTIDQNISTKNLQVDTNGLSFVKGVIKTIHGKIVFKFYSKKAPNASTRIIQLIQSGFYDGLVFHRVHQNYIIQTGDPTGTGVGGSGKKIKAEFNNIQHIRGTIGMARTNSDTDSADSQFYIALTTLPHLDGKYTVFAQVVEGLQLLHKIKKGDKILSITLKKNN